MKPSEQLGFDFVFRWTGFIWRMRWELLEQLLWEVSLAHLLSLLLTGRREIVFWLVFHEVGTSLCCNIWLPPSWTWNVLGTSSLIIIRTPVAALSVVPLVTLVPAVVVTRPVLISLPRLAVVVIVTPRFGLINNLPCAVWSCCSCPLKHSLFLWWNSP